MIKQDLWAEPKKAARSHGQARLRQTARSGSKEDPFDSHAIRFGQNFEKLQGLRSVEAGHANGLRRGSPRLQSNVCRRSSRRSGGSDRQAVCGAGHLLDKALLEAGIDRSKVYVTNAVKHFNWEPRGKRRIHKKPGAKEIAACRPWLDAEIARLRPQVIVCLGATAAQALLGRDFRVTQHRGEFVESSLAPHVTATVHPSAILRAPDDETRHQEMKRFVEDLKKIAKVIS
jgi:uracil-DNA glycosylase family 4